MTTNKNQRATVRSWTVMTHRRAVDTDLAENICDDIRQLLWSWAKARLLVDFEVIMPVSWPLSIVRRGIWPPVSHNWKGPSYKQSCVDDCPICIDFDFRFTASLVRMIVSVFTYSHWCFSTRWYTFLWTIVIHWEGGGFIRVIFLIKKDIIHSQKMEIRW